MGLISGPGISTCHRCGQPSQPHFTRSLGFLFWLPQRGINLYVVILLLVSNLTAVWWGNCVCLITILWNLPRQEFPLWLNGWRIQLGIMRFQVRSLALLSGLGIRRCCELWLGHRCSSDSVLLGLWHRLAAVAPVRPLAWEPLYATGAALKKGKKKKNSFLHNSFYFSA